MQENMKYCLKRKFCNSFKGCSTLLNKTDAVNNSEELLKINGTSYNLSKKYSVPFKPIHYIYTIHIELQILINKKKIFESRWIWTQSRLKL